MQLRLFTKETQNEWVQEGFDSVKITASDRLSVNNDTNPFFLLEPYNNTIDQGDENIVQNIASDTVEEIILHKTGRHYQ
ncbi:MAG TPA: hypothetical protein VL093_05375 [Flavipsychrobacter sp.]|jgi:hypothetical protein|nr:hypothetical protein [Flavipsychrobacter sp.]